MYAPSPETYFEKHRPPMASGGAARRGAARQTRVAHRSPGATPHQPHTHTRRNEISRSGGAPPHSDVLSSSSPPARTGAREPLRLRLEGALLAAPVPTSE